MKKVVTDLQKRNLVETISSEKKLNLLDKNVRLYIGFDPTAISLHIGNYLQILTLLRFKKAGFNPIAILGGATGFIGDPSFKNSERKLIDEKTFAINKQKIRNQLENFGLDVIDNFSFYKHINFIDFLRKAGKLINVSYLLAKESIKNRINSGISFTEFSYNIIQGYDFLWLFENKNVCLQMGGSDQWGNISTGLDMIKKLYPESNAVGITLKLITDEHGNKFGKTSEGKRYWLDPEKTSPFEMYQFLFNSSDLQVKNLLLWLTFLEVEEIEQLIILNNKNPQKRLAQKMLAYEVTKDIHGLKNAKIASNLSSLLFNGLLDLKNLNSKEISWIKKSLPIFICEENQNFLEFLTTNKICQSKREAREWISKKTFTINSQIIDHFDFQINFQNQNFALLKKGKKTYYFLEKK